MIGYVEWGWSKAVWSRVWERMGVGGVGGVERVY